MLRRKPTRLELTSAEEEEYERMANEVNKERMMNESKADGEETQKNWTGPAGKDSRSAAVASRIGYKGTKI
eukprot:m.244976 g.244976  ORF g.244976 m.244976 type:complete len:71 (+) comp16106_c0_seq29:159-371(+)